MRRALAQQTARADKAEGRAVAAERNAVIGEAGGPFRAGSVQRVVRREYEAYAEHYGDQALPIREWFNHAHTKADPLFASFWSQVNAGNANPAGNPGANPAAPPGAPGQPGAPVAPPQPPGNPNAGAVSAPVPGTGQLDEAAILRMSPDEVRANAKRIEQWMQAQGHGIAGLAPGD